MSDLISRQAVIGIIHKEIERTNSYAEHETQINIEMAVKELPTAYSVEKVMAELDKQSIRVGIRGIDGNHDILSLIPTIDIVRNGGKE